VLPIQREDYLELVERTGKAVRKDKSGAIPENLQPILQRLQINPIHRYSTVSNYKYAFGKVVGSIVHLDDWRNKDNN
jgi:hypothetical protein